MPQNRPTPSRAPQNPVLRTALSLGRYNRVTGLGKRVSELTRGRYSQIGSVLADFGRTLVYYAPIHAALEHHLGGQLKGKTGLHLAAGTGVYTRYLQDLGVKAVGLDKSAGAQEIAKKLGNKEWVWHDADLDRPGKRGKADFPFPEKTFDFFVSDRFLFSNFGPIEHRGKVGSSLYILKRLGRVLKPGAIGVLTVSESSALTRARLQAAGFRLLEVRPAVTGRKIALADHADIVVIQKQS